MTEGTYVITVRGVAGPAVRAAFDGTAISAVDDTTVLRSAGTDQAALHGILQKIQDLGLEILEVQLESAEPASGIRWPGSRISDV
jgi:hypothetical protein